MSGSKTRYFKWKGSIISKVTTTFKFFGSFFSHQWIGTIFDPIFFEAESLLVGRVDVTQFFSQKENKSKYLS